MCLTFEDIKACMRIEATYGERGKDQPLYGEIPTPTTNPEKSVQIRTYIGTDPKNGEQRLMTK